MKTTYNTVGGTNLNAATNFVKDISKLVAEPGHEVTITVGDIKLVAYDHASLIDGLIDAVNYFVEEMSL